MTRTRMERQRIVVLWNETAGQLRGRTSYPRLVSALVQAGVAADVQRVPGSELAERARAEARRGAAMVVAAGGDGTVSSVAAALAGTGTALGVLPLGTRNHFARDLGLPLDLEGAARVLAEGVVRRVDVAEVNGHRFVNNSSIGLYPHIVADRDGQRQRLGRGRWLAMAIAVARAFRRSPSVKVLLEDGGRTAEHRTPFVFVGNNEYSARLLSLAGRDSLSEGRLGVYLSRRTGRFALVRLAFRALIGRLKQARDFEALRLPELRIRASRRRVKVALDGELVTLRPPLHFRSHPGALQVVVPAGAAGARTPGRPARREAS